MEHTARAPGIIALDVGDHRIGVAAGERGSSWVFGRGVLTNKPLDQLVPELTEVMKNERASLIVIGLPVNLDGSDSVQTTRVREFAAGLEARGFTTTFQDERLTSKVAEQQIATSHLPRMKRQQKGLVDEAAAVLILETYLARTGSQ